uniref:Beta-glucosidase (EC) n=1 Tax=Ganoderma boninense TaxID=34458 RepID=A0A5K1K0S8_9APHY|nr:Beta-glucosidase (EC [Ganoderma boninense]
MEPDWVEKGQEFCRFHLGGSQKEANVELDQQHSPDETLTKFASKIAGSTQLDPKSGTSQRRAWINLRVIWLAMMMAG